MFIKLWLDVQHSALIIILLLWLIETDVFQIPQLHKHFNVGRNELRTFHNLQNMPSDTSNKIEWPDELDALVAAAEHHKLLMENDLVRVIDTLIPPGQITNIHTHKWPASLYVISWSDFIRYDAKGNVIVDSRKLAQTPLPSSAIWSEALKPHALENIGDHDIHIISVEIKT